MKQYIFNIGLATLAVLAPLQTAIIGCGFLILMDLLFAIIAAVKNGEKIESKKLKVTVVKMFVYQLFLISGFIAETYLSSYVPFVKIILTYLSSVEILSISENFQKITGLPILKWIKEQIMAKLNKGKED
jgi:hypothetical protein